MNLYFGKIDNKKKTISRKEYLDLEQKIVKKNINKNGFSHDKNGRPILNNKLKLSITNNNKLVVIAVHNKDIGIDLQLIKHNDKENEIRLFSMLEALYKAYNIPYGQIKDFKINIFKKNYIIINKKKFVLYSKVLNNYIFSICAEY